MISVEMCTKLIILTLIFSSIQLVNYLALHSFISQSMVSKIVDLETILRLKLSSCPLIKLIQNHLNLTQYSNQNIRTAKPCGDSSAVSRR